MKPSSRTLKAMSYGHKSNRADRYESGNGTGRRSYPDQRAGVAGRATGRYHPCQFPTTGRRKPNMDAPFHGVMLPDDVKANIEKTRHAGKIVDLELTTGKKEPCYISRDPLTNTLEYYACFGFPHKKDMKGTTLSDGDQMNIAAGSKGLLEKFVTRAGYLPRLATFR